jgi:hypothetical protein
MSERYRIAYENVVFEDIVERYQQLRSMASSMYQEAMWQYTDMAMGGDGGPLGFTPEDWARACVDNMLPVDTDPTCRAYNYPGYPNHFFGDVLAALNEPDIGRGI